MNTVVSGDDFDKAMLPGHLKREVVVIIEAAAIMGWDVHITSRNSVTIVSYDKVKTYHFGLKSRGSSNLQRIRKDILKHGDPLKIADAGKIVDPTVPDAVKKAAASRLKEREETQIDDRPKPTERKHRNEPTEVTLVSIRPMVAKARQGQAYDSETTLVRTWSDGSQDHVCAWEGCDYSSTVEERLAVSAHYGKAHRRGQGVAEHPPVYAGEVPEAKVYAPRRSRVAALAGVIASIIEGSDGLNPEEIAEAALKWVHEQSRQGTGLSAEAEELDDSDILNRIRMLLDDGTAWRIREELSEKDQQIIDLSARLDEAERQATAARETLKAFTDLATELAAGQEAG